MSWRVPHANLYPPIYTSDPIAKYFGMDLEAYDESTVDRA